jgi:hypothetical protein
MDVNMSNLISFSSARPDVICHAVLPAAHVYNTIELSDGWLAEVEFDNLLHEGYGKSEPDAGRDALPASVSAGTIPCRRLDLLCSA